MGCTWEGCIPSSYKCPALCHSRNRKAWRNPYFTLLLTTLSHFKNVFMNFSSGTIWSKSCWKRSNISHKSLNCVESHFIWNTSFQKSSLIIYKISCWACFPLPPQESNAWSGYLDIRYMNADVLLEWVLLNHDCLIFTSWLGTLHVLWLLSFKYAQLINRCKQNTFSHNFLIQNDVYSNRSMFLHSTPRTQCIIVFRELLSNVDSMFYAGRLVIVSNLHCNGFNSRLKPV
jgi:hypothetical protein